MKSIKRLVSILVMAAVVLSTASVASAKEFATVNGKKVAVGSTVTIQWKAKCTEDIMSMHVYYTFDHKALKVTNPEEKRFKNWLSNTSILNQKNVDMFEIVGVDPDDPYNMAALPCKNGVVADTMKVKVLKGGKYTIKAKIGNSQGADGSIPAKKIKYTYKVK